MIPIRDPKKRKLFILESSSEGESEIKSEIDICISCKREGSTSVVLFDMEIEEEDMNRLCSECMLKRLEILKDNNQMKLLISVDRCDENT